MVDKQINVFKYEQKIRGEISFDQFDLHFNWIKKSDPKYIHIKSRLIEQTFAKLNPTDKDLLMTYLIKLINFIYKKFYLNSTYWDQLTQNNMLDLRALLNMLLPFISDDATDSKKGKLTSLEDLYTARSDDNKFVFTNMQYNRCIRYMSGSEIKYVDRPFISEYFMHHFKLLLMSIEASANKLYVNWIDIIPVRMSEYTSMPIYTNTLDKISAKKSDLLLGYIDVNFGLSYHDIYNTIANHFYFQIVKCKWLIFDVPTESNKLVGLLSYLESKIHLDPIWDQKLWSHLTDSERNIFDGEWTLFKKSSVNTDQVVTFYIYLFMLNGFGGSNKLIKQGLLKVMTETITTDEEENRKIEKSDLLNAQIGLAAVPTEDIYAFLSDQLNTFRKSWYYYVIKIQKKDTYELVDEYKSNTLGIKFITPKNFYNFAKSIIHFQLETDYPAYPRYWQSLPPNFLNQFMNRLLNPNVGITKLADKWFNISQYISRAYKTTTIESAIQINDIIELTVRANLIDAIFQSMIYHGILSKFVPQKEITDLSIIDKKIGSADENKRVVEKRKQIKRFVLTDAQKKLYSQGSYYYLTAAPYGLSYLDEITDKMEWTDRYAINWVSQINFYHRYNHNRVIYVTGATGVGKSTEIPKLLFYSMYMLDYRIDGKTICTIPRRQPVTGSAEFVSEQMGVPIIEYDSTYKRNIPTSNYFVQFKHKEAAHINTSAESFLRFVTDGTLLEELKRSPFLSRATPRPGITDSAGNPIDWIMDYKAGNKYDIVIVDEAHEHNTNMDIILTLMRDSVYVNNSLKLVIISATMDDDEPIYRRYYRTINDNRGYPLNAFIAYNTLDRANCDRRIDISKPRETTQFKVTDHFLSKAESDTVTDQNYVQKGIQKTIDVLKKTTSGHILLFMAGKEDINKCITEINANTPESVICLGYHGELSEDERKFIIEIDKMLPLYTKGKISSRPIVSAGTYKRAVIVATNAAEASISIPGLSYVIDTGYAKVNVYDPIAQVSKLITMPISQTSSTQRRGRVGRKAPGTVYYLYDKEKVANNKTAYKIADENITDTLVAILKKDPTDFPIVTQFNDVNDIDILNRVINEYAQKKHKINGSQLYYFFGNIRIYENIVLKQYMMIDDMPKIASTDQFYMYYGVGVIEQFDPKVYSTISYLTNNHDDYDFQAGEKIRTRCNGGFDSDKLEDDASNLDFYIIHPDENIISRDPFTGKMIGIKKSLSVKPSYYYRLLDINQLLNSDVVWTALTNKKILTKEQTDQIFSGIDFNEFILPKFDIFMDIAKQRGLVIGADTKLFDKPSVRLEGAITDRMKSIMAEYYANINRMDMARTTLIKTSLTDKMADAASITGGNVNILSDPNFMQWYLYGYVHGPDIQVDILALAGLLSAENSFGNFVTDKFFSTIKKFTDKVDTSKGDLYYFWILWSRIKSTMNRFQLEPIKIDDRTKIKFSILKDKFHKQIKIDNVDEYVLIKNMYKTGKLYTTDEFYEYVKVSKITDEHIIVMYHDKIKSVSKIISDSFEINSNVITPFIVRHLVTISEVNRYVWLYTYVVDHQLNDDMLVKETNVLDWVKYKLTLPRIFGPDPYDKIYETYLRAFSANLVLNRQTYYVMARTGLIIELAPWSKKNNAENTLLLNKTKYEIFHHEKSTEKQVNIFYLSPCALKLIVKLNPIYYYFYVKNSAEILAQTNPNDPLRQSAETKVMREIIADINKVFDRNQVVTYVNQLDDKIMLKIFNSQN